MVRFLIACSGQAQRWNNYMGVAKHLIKINGERLLDRTIRLISEIIKEDYEIIVVAFNDLYKSDGSTLQIPHYDTQIEKDQHFANPFMYVSRKWWSDSDTNVILFGDVYFTEDAINTIIGDLHKLNDYTFYGRPYGSKFTGCLWGEIFGISFTCEFSNNLWSNILELKQLKDENKIKRFISWEIYRKLQSIDLSIHEIKDNFTIIDDFTEDFDYPEDYDRWIECWNKSNEFNIIYNSIYVKI